MLDTQSIQITPELLALIAEIDEFKGAWRALGTLAPERLNALRQTQGSFRDATPNWQPWLLFFLRAVRQQTRRLAAKIEDEQRLLATLPELAVRILEQACQHGRVTMGDMIRLTGANRNTLKEHFRRLVKQGHLTPQGMGR